MAEQGKTPNSPTSPPPGETEPGKDLREFQELRKEAVDEVNEVTDKSLDRIQKALTEALNVIRKETNNDNRESVSVTAVDDARNDALRQIKAASEAIDTKTSAFCDSCGVSLRVTPAQRDRKEQFNCPVCRHENKSSVVEVARSINLRPDDPAVVERLRSLGHV